MAEQVTYAGTLICIQYIVVTASTKEAALGVNAVHVAATISRLHAFVDVHTFCSVPVHQPQNVLTWQLNRGHYIVFIA
jgi:hypothetical protein